MSKDMFSIIDLGHSKIRFSIFDKNKDIIFSENLSVIFDNQYSNHFYIIEGLKYNQHNNYLHY